MRIFSRTATMYSVDIPKDKLLKLFRREWNTRDPNYVTLSTALDKLPGVSDADYNGHFGAAIFFTIEDEDDTPETHAKINALIDEHLR